MRIEVIAAWPRQHRSVSVDAPEGVSVEEAVTLAGFDTLEGVSGYAVFGIRAHATTQLRDGDRVELLRPLQMDPKDARRLRAGKPKT